MKKKKKVIGLVTAGAVAGLVCTFFVAPAGHAATGNNGFEFFHNRIAEDVKFCVDESDASGKRIYHKCRLVPLEGKWGHYNSPGAKTLWVHLQPIADSWGLKTENLGPLDAGQPWCFRSQTVGLGAGFVDNTADDSLMNCTFG